MNIIFNEDQKDILRELINISLGEATANIAQLLEAFGTMHIPQINIENSQNLQSFISKDLDATNIYYVTKQLFSGSFGGEVIFIVSSESSQNLAKSIFKVEDSSQDDISDAVMEMTNIVTSTIISRLAQELGVNVQFFAPASSLIYPKDIVDYDDVANYSTVIIFKTIIDFHEQNISGTIFILTKDEAIDRLRDLIDRKLQELYS